MKPPRDLLLMAVDLGLLATIYLLPFVMGGRQAIGELTLTVIACWTATCWLLRQAVRRESKLRLTLMTPLLVFGIGIGLLQVWPLPQGLLGQLSPHLERLLPTWSSSLGQKLLNGPWSTVSLTPVETQRSLVCIIDCAMLFVVTVNRVRTLADVHRIVKWVALSATLMALFGSVQYLFGNGRFFWVYDHPFTNTRDYAKGAFTNPNHFADFVAMALPLLLAWLTIHSLTSAEPVAYHQRPTWRQRGEGHLIVVCLGCVCFSLLLSQSRGGLLAAACGVIACLFFLHRGGALTGRVAGLLGGSLCVAVLSLTMFGDRLVAIVESNFHELASADIAQLDRGEGRRKIWEAAIDGLQDYPLLGTGISSHREVYWTYFNHPDNGTEFSHAENGYLQLALETGGLGLATALGCLLIWLVWCLDGLRRAQSVEVAALLAAILGVLVINGAHSVTDFVWYAPGIMGIVVVLAACAAALHRLATEPPVERAIASPPLMERRFHPMWGMASLGGVALAVWMIPQKLPALTAEPHWFEYIRMVQLDDRLSDDISPDVHQRNKHRALLRAAACDPDDARIQLRTARACQAMFEVQQRTSENPMSLLQIQDAAFASEWDSPQELVDWLNLPGVLGENRKYLDAANHHAVKAVNLCPLLSEGYLLLAEQQWINGISTPTENALLSQALLARPYDAEVHYVVGRVASLRGNEPAALEHWTKSFQRSPRFRKQITKLLAPVWPASRFVEQFQPDTNALMHVVEAYRSSPDVDGFRLIAAQLAAELEQRADSQQYDDAIRTWHHVYRLHTELGDAAGAGRAAHGAVAAEPNNFIARRNLAKWLFSEGQYSDAVEHLQWCLRRRPEDREVEGWLHAATSRQSPAAPQLTRGQSTDPRRL